MLPGLGGDAPSTAGLWSVLHSTNSIGRSCRFGNDSLLSHRPRSALDLGDLLTEAHRHLLQLSSSSSIPIHDRQQGPKHQTYCDPLRCHWPNAVPCIPCRSPKSYQAWYRSVHLGRGDRQPGKISCRFAAVGVRTPWRITFLLVRLPAQPVAQTPKTLGVAAPEAPPLSTWRRRCSVALGNGCWRSYCSSWDDRYRRLVGQYLRWSAMSAFSKPEPRKAGLSMLRLARCPQSRAGRNSGHRWFLARSVLVWTRGR